MTNETDKITIAEILIALALAAFCYYVQAFGIVIS
jgi:hypothetical protein